MAAREPGQIVFWCDAVVTNRAALYYRVAPLSDDYGRSGQDVSSPVDNTNSMSGLWRSLTIRERSLMTTHQVKQVDKVLSQEAGPVSWGKEVAKAIDLVHRAQSRTTCAPGFGRVEKRRRQDNGKTYRG
jgi:hypothetical protein